MAATEAQPPAAPSGGHLLSSADRWVLERGRDITDLQRACSGSRLRLTTSGQLQSLHLDPAHWWAGLCRAADRPYTTAERGRLPAGAHAGPPCRT
ncbi:hypothetical protein ACGFZB_21830 [Streptomyces cinerochromogenes]|uniref:Uncharacterized protein n=1 Tax=Streptomyces cinerochromogenes TaxID=66422 RepID=A0ABW7BBL0_9ACTN